MSQRAAALAGKHAGSIRHVNPRGGTQNCVNCAIATDATLAGRPASALASSGPQPISVPARTFVGSFRAVSGAEEIQQLLLEADLSARGIVFGSRGADPGHVFNAVNQRGVIRFLDGKIGGPASLDGFDGFYFPRTNP
ncbi:MAG TPA: toxin glutamine deamidase domain-containing protein [Acidimicrobiales bacterium]|nr:toxin glutamine deamidase domain-containing protein [Acidimicrobiales bacterium]